MRDWIPEIIKESGRTPITRVLDRDEFRIALLDKLQEEVDEYLQRETTEELADILEVVCALAEQSNVSRGDLAAMRHEKWQSRGRFKKRIFLDAERIPYT